MQEDAERRRWNQAADCAGSSQTEVELPNEGTGVPEKAGSLREQPEPHSGARLLVPGEEKEARRPPSAASTSPSSCQFWTDSWPESWREVRALARRIQLQAGGCVDRKAAKALRNLSVGEALETLSKLQVAVDTAQRAGDAAPCRNLSAMLLQASVFRKKTTRTGRQRGPAMGGEADATTDASFGCETCADEGVQQQQEGSGRSRIRDHPSSRTFARFLEASERVGNPREIHNAAKVAFGDGQKLLPMSLKHLDRFLKLRCCVPLLEMGLFPDAKEITESMGCLWAVKTRLGDSLRFEESKVTCVVVGDGGRPRTAALACFLTRWRRVVSIDPALATDDRHRAIERIELRAHRVQAATVELDA